MEFIGISQCGRQLMLLALAWLMFTFLTTQT